MSRVESRPPKHFSFGHKKPVRNQVHCLRTGASFTMVLFERVIGRFAGDDYVVDMTLAETLPADPYEAGFLL